MRGGDGAGKGEDATPPLSPFSAREVESHPGSATCREVGGPGGTQNVILSKRLEIYRKLYFLGKLTLRKKSHCSAFSE